MNDKTGEIREMTPDMADELNRLSHMAGELTRLGAWVPIPDGELSNVQGMNRAQRRAWAKQQRKGVNR